MARPAPRLGPPAPQGGAGLSDAAVLERARAELARSQASRPELAGTAPAQEPQFQPQSQPRSRGKQADRPVPDRPAPDRSAPSRPGPTRPASSGEASHPAPPTQPARRRSVRMALISFVALVVLPGLVAAGYLYTRAVDQYASVMAFSVRSEDSRSAFDMLGQLGGGFAFGGGAASTDGEILYQFIQSQELVARIDAALDLRTMFARHHATDPVFAFRPGGTIEDLTDHWSRRLRIAFDTATGLIEIRVLAFDPEEARTVAHAILEESTRRINELSAAAREDATRHAREDLELALERLRAAREAMTAFRIRTQIVDPAADLQGQMGVLNTLQGQLAEALIELDLLRETTREGDPRITQQQRRIEVIRARIADERTRIGGGVTGPTGEDFATVMAEFERLNLEREFAEQTYGSALSAFDAAVAQAQRNSRYLATHIAPTLAESARYPEREMLLALTVFFLGLAWAVGALVYYSVRDSR